MSKLPRPVKIKGEWKNRPSTPERVTYSQFPPLRHVFSVHSIGMEFFHNEHNDDELQGILKAFVYADDTTFVHNTLQSLTSRDQGVAIVEHGGFIWTEPRVHHRRMSMRTDMTPVYDSEQAAAMASGMVRHGYQVEFNLLGSWRCPNNGGPYREAIFG